MDAEKLKEYRKWQGDLISCAIRDFGFHSDVITPLVEGHHYQEYFEEGCTTWEAMQQDQHNGL